MNKWSLHLLGLNVWPQMIFFGLGKRPDLLKLFINQVRVIPKMNSVANLLMKLFDCGPV